MAISAERRSASLDRFSGFIFWFPCGVPIVAMERQLYARIDLCQLAKNEPQAVLFCDEKWDSCRFVRFGEGVLNAREARSASSRRDFDNGASEHANS
jgi:hypothetical protein